MAINQERVSRKFSFILKSGTEVFPVLVKDRNTGNIAFRVSLGGTGSNKTVNQDQVDENTMLSRVLSQNYQVRCSSLDGKTTGMYKKGERSVERVVQGSWARSGTYEVMCPLSAHFGRHRGHLITSAGRI